MARLATSNIDLHQAAASSDAPAEVALPCPSCGYDLRATVADRCPECGGAVDDEVRGGEATIPWQHRRRIGRVRAFFATVGWALFSPTRLAQQAGRRIDYRSARRFQFVCCLVGAAALGAVLTPDLRSLRNRYVRLVPDPTVTWQTTATQSVMEWAGDIAILAGLWVGLFGWLLLGSGVASYYFHPRRLSPALQQRAVALSYYAAAPLVLLVPLAAVVFGVDRFARTTLGPGEQIGVPQAVMWGIQAVIFVWCVVWTWWLPAHLLMRGLHDSAGRAAALLLTTAVTWPLLLLLTLVLIPGLVFYVQFLWLLLS